MRAILPGGPLDAHLRGRPTRVHLSQNVHAAGSPGVHPSQNVRVTGSPAVHLSENVHVAGSPAVHLPQNVHVTGARVHLSENVHVACSAGVHLPYHVHVMGSPGVRLWGKVPQGCATRGRNRGATSVLTRHTGADVPSVR